VEGAKKNTSQCGLREKGRAIVGEKNPREIDGRIISDLKGEMIINITMSAVIREQRIERREASSHDLEVQGGGRRRLACPEAENKLEL